MARSWLRRGQPLTTSPRGAETPPAAGPQRTLSAMGDLYQQATWDHLASERHEALLAPYATILAPAEERPG
ncbi:MAG: hypothetical protein IVW57_05795, partial [Ktedonobacterales bacterium]|nr:hypothetical protein [Ktedonobacterales bacterium]